MAAAPTPLPQLTRDQIQQVFKDPALVRAYEALQKNLQYTPGDVATLTTEVEAIQALVTALAAAPFVTIDGSAGLDNERTLAVDPDSMSLTDGGPGASVTLASHLNVEEVDGSPAGQVTKLVLPNGTLTIVGGVATYTPAAGGLTPIADKTLLANISGALAVPVGTTVSALLDAALGSTQGQLVTRNAGSWTVLNPGTTGFVLTSNGPGANLSFAAPVINVLPIDQFTSGLWAAYGLKRYLTSYTGPLLRVRDTTTSATQDIGYVVGTNLLDVAALTTFLGAHSGTVAIWYDQSGLGHDLVQATTTTQPLIYSAGTYLGAVTPDGVDDCMVTTANSSGTNRAFHMFTKYLYPTGGGTTQVMVEQNSNSTGSDSALLYNSSNQLNFGMFQTTPSVHSITIVPGNPLNVAAVSAVQVVTADWCWDRDGGGNNNYSLLAARDGATVSGSTGSTTGGGTLIGNFSAAPWRIFNRAGNNFPSVMRMQGFLIYEANIEAKRTAIIPYL